MASPSQSRKAETMRRELIALMLASLACVVVLTLSIVERPKLGFGGVGVQQLLLFVLVAGIAIGAAALVMIVTARARRVMRLAREESAQLKRSLMTAEAIFKAEPQVLVFWEHADGLKVITHTLNSVVGLPADQADLLKFGTWLEPSAALDLKRALDDLFNEARAFNMFLKTKAGGHLEADGRATGTRAVLRLRDVAGTKRDIVRILDQNRKLSHDIRNHQALLNSLPIAAWMSDGDGQISWINNAYVEAVEAKDAAQVYEAQISLLETRQRVQLRNAMVKGEAFSQRTHIVVGGERRAHDVVGIQTDDTIAAAAIDVAALETAQGELDRQVSAFDRTLDRVASPVAIFGRDQRLSFYNEAYRKLWELDPDWLDKSPTDSEVMDRLKELSRLPAMVDYRGWKSQLLACYKSETPYEDWWQLPGGRMLHVVAEQRPDGGVTYLYEDVSEQLALESRYNALIEVQRETLDSIKEGVAVFATDGRLQLFNSAFLAIWRLSRLAMGQGPHIGEFISLAKVLHEDDKTWQKISEAVTSISYEREPLSGQMVRPDASVIDYALTPLPDGGTLVTFADVTVSKSYERALIERNEALEAADNLKSQFISHVSYELRAPLTNIIGFSELLAGPQAGDLNEKQHEYLTDIRQSSQTLLSIINDILDLATIDAGALELDIKPTKVQPLIESVLNGVKERAGRARLTLEIATSDDVDELFGDEDRLRQVLYNLLANAVGFSKPGGLVRLSCWLEDEDVVFAIEDNGVGIPEDQLDRIFDRFESHSHGSKHRGAGLGLSIVKSLVELHGGTLTIDSEPDRGTTVTVRLPQLGKRRPLKTKPAQIEDGSAAHGDKTRAG
jgi:signal transduction histidine kinase